MLTIGGVDCGGSETEIIETGENTHRNYVRCMVIMRNNIKKVVVRPRCIKKTDDD